MISTTTIAILAIAIAMIAIFLIIRSRRITARHIAPRTVKTRVHYCHHCGSVGAESDMMFTAPCPSCGDMGGIHYLTVGSYQRGKWRDKFGRIVQATKSNFINIHNHGSNQ